MDRIVICLKSFSFKGTLKAFKILIEVQVKSFLGL